MNVKVKEVGSEKELNEIVKRRGAIVIVELWASWCEASKQMEQLMSHLSTDFPHLHFLRVEAEEHPDICETYSVSAVPFVLFFKDGKLVDQLEGADPSTLANKVSKLGGVADPLLAAGPTVLETVKQVNIAAKNEDALKKRLEQLINSAPVMLFMKGSPEEPKCGFSKKVVNILKDENVKFKTFDILTDNEVREGLKKFSNWPTFPQLYHNGELLGGCDIIIAMHENGELKDVITEPTAETLQDRLKRLITSSPVMLFMKGSPDAPQCGFSSKVVNALNQEGVTFGSFDILSDEEVRQGLKVFSNWPTFPQLYYKGELMGGCDIIMELKNNGELKATLSE